MTLYETPVQLSSVHITARRCDTSEGLASIPQKQKETETYRTGPLVVVYVCHASSSFSTLHRRTSLKCYGCETRGFSWF